MESVAVILIKIQQSRFVFTFKIYHAAADHPLYSFKELDNTIHQSISVGRTAPDVRIEVFSELRDQKCRNSIFTGSFIDLCEP